MKIETGVIRFYLVPHRSLIVHERSFREPSRQITDWQDRSQ
jgi:hypothetical protein